jgi:hypothetical protein
LATKVKPSANGSRKGIFFRVPKKGENRHILKKKKLQVAIFRQWVSSIRRRQNWAGIFFLESTLLLDL